MITQDRLKELLRYDPVTGIFVWRSRTGRSAAGKTAGWLDPHGYLVVTVDRKNYLLHRLAWLYMIGVWPNHIVDHINRTPLDNRWVNLRAANKSQNGHNSARFHTASGLKGVVRNKNGKRWVATIMIDYKAIHLGTFDTKKEAHAAYCQASQKYLGEYAANPNLAVSPAKGD